MTALPICFVDTETTSLRPDRRAWDVAVIRRERGQPDSEHQWFVHCDDLDLGNADLFALRVGRFHDRHPQDWTKGVEDEKWVMRCAERTTRGAVLVGAVPSFDAEVLAARMRACGIAPSWHYQVQDFETLIAGFLRGQAKPVPELPWKSDDLSRLIGVEPPGEDDRHTALGDARWAQRVWDAVMGGPLG